MAAGLAGFSLVEVMIGMVVFGILIAALSSASIQSQRLAYGNIYANTAHTVVQGYAEQIKSIGYQTIKDALEQPDTYTIPTMALSLLGTVAGGSMEIDDPLQFGEVNQKDILVDVETDDLGNVVREKVMRLWVRPTGVKIANREAIQITLEFGWEAYGGANYQRVSSIKVVKTDVSEY